MTAGIWMFAGPPVHEQVMTFVSSPKSDGIDYDELSDVLKYNVDVGRKTLKVSPLNNT